MLANRWLARGGRALATCLLLITTVLIATADAPAASSRADATPAPLGASLSLPRFEGSRAVREPPPAGAHRVGEATVWAPLTTIATAMPGPAPLSVGVITMLHGACGAPVPTCALFSDDVTTRDWLVCPTGNATCAGGALDWRGSSEEKAAHLDAARDSIDTRYGDLMGPREILAGFSRGAFVARDVAYARPHRYRALILIGAAIQLDPERLRASGIERVALVSGRHDGARPTMVAATARLAAQGLSARFFDAGPIYHELPADLGRLMAEIVAWIDG